MFNSMSHNNLRKSRLFLKINKKKGPPVRAGLGGDGMVRYAVPAVSASEKSPNTKAPDR